MRVLQVLGASAGGIARHVSLVTGVLDGRDGLEVDVAAPPGLPVDMPKDIVPVSIPDGPVRGHASAIARLRRIVRTGGYDVVHAHGLRAGVDAGLAARGGPPVVVTVHNVVLPEIAGRLKARAYRLSEPLAVVLSHRTLAVSDDIAVRLRRWGRGKVETLYLGVGPVPPMHRPAEATRALAGARQGDRMIVTASRLAPQKAVDVMLEAVARLPDSVVLAVLGDGPHRDRLGDHAARLGIDDRVAWLGWRDDAADFVAAADVFCLSSLWEGIPLAAQEAMQLGTPVVATAVGGVPELIEDGRTGRLVAPQDPVALAAALADVLGAGHEAAGLAAAARAELARRFSIEDMLARLEAVYREVSR